MTTAMTAQEIAFWDNLAKALKEIYGEKVVVVASDAGKTK